MQKLKLAATLLLSMSTGVGLPLVWSAMATRLDAQTAGPTALPQDGRHSILEDRPEASGSFEESLPAPMPEPQVGDSQVAGSQPNNLPPSELRSLNWPTLPTKMGYDVLWASPVHEALISAGEVSLSPASSKASFESQSLPVAVAPPAPVRENPTRPAIDKPLGADEPSSAGEWIGGYWAWLPEMRNYVWVSGVRRISPPGRVWTAGSWNHTAAGYQWLPGYWDVADDALAMKRTTEPAADALARKILPAPPAARTSGPTKAPPNANSFWIPGHWVARADWQNRAAEAKDTDAYQWLDGYWTQHVNQWIWQPARVVFVGDGFRTVSGYWDYEPQYRGQGYAAVAFHPNTLDDSNYTFEPVYPLSRAPALLLHLFVQAERGRLFYGDLYSDSQVALGYRPWYLPIEQPSSAPPMLVGSNALTLPPLLDYYQWQYHTLGVNFIASMARYAEHFRSAPSIRPAAQTDKRPELAIHEGLAGRVNANSFEQIVLGNVGGRRPLLLDGSPAQADIASRLRRSGSDTAVTQASASQASTASQVSATSRAKVPVGDSSSQRNLAYNSDSASASRSTGPAAGSAQQLPRGATPFGQRGNAAMLVLPGGRVVLAPPGLVPPSLPVGPNGGLLAPPAFPLPPGPLGGFRGRLGRR